MTRAGRLKNTRLQEKVVAAPTSQADLSQYEDPAAELFRSLAVVPLQKRGNTFIVTLEGRDPARTKRLLEVLLGEFAERSQGRDGEKIG